MPAIAGQPEYSLIIPVYKNEESIEDVLGAVAGIQDSLGESLEVVFVVDGSPDRSQELLANGLLARNFPSQLIALSRNFGSFAAIRVGLIHAKGKYLAVMAADLQEPPQLIVEFFDVLARESVDVVLGTRRARTDKPLDRLAAGVFWKIYRRFVQPDVPKGGVDVFGCNQAFKERLVSLSEANSSLIGQILWLGFRRKEIPYNRLERRHGESAWTFSGKLKYLMDSIFSFTDLPIRLLLSIGMAGLGISFALGALTAIARFFGWVQVPGYAATILVIVFFAALNMLGFGIVGSYVWRGFENSKQRPSAIVLEKREFEGTPNK